LQIIRKVLQFETSNQDRGVQHWLKRRSAREEKPAVREEIIMLHNEKEIIQTYTKATLRAQTIEDKRNKVTVLWKQHATIERVMPGGKPVMHFEVRMERDR
jgi:hypothetical protein